MPNAIPGDTFYLDVRCNQLQYRIVELERQIRELNPGLPPVEYVASPPARLPDNA